VSSFFWREALESDEQAVLELCGRLYEEDPSPEPVPIAHTRHTLRTLRAEPSRGRVVVLEGGRIVVGYAFLIAFWSNELGGETCELRSIAQGSGPWPRRPVALGLQVTKDNARAKELYVKLGFREWKNTLMVWRI
jgi:hypothetical protein